MTYPPAYRRGFTLIELMIVLIVAAILAGIAAPSFAEMIRSHRLTTQANLLLSELHRARTEAVRRGVQITLRRSSSTDSDWTQGWQMFADIDGDGQFDNGTDTVLATRQSLKRGFTLTSGNNYDEWLAFLPSGYPTSSGSALGNDTFRLCYGSDEDNARSIVVNNTGRPVVREGATSCP